MKQEKVFILKNVVNFIIVYELDAYSRDSNTVFTSKVSIQTNILIQIIWYWVWSSSLFPILNSWGKNLVIFGGDKVHQCIVIIRKEIILVIYEGPRQGLDGSSITSEAKYSINFIESGKRFAFSLHSNGSNSFLFVNVTNICQFKVKVSEIKPNILCLRNIQKHCTANNMKKTGFNGYVYDFTIDYNIIDISDIINSHKYLMKEHDIK